MGFHDSLPGALLPTTAATLPFSAVILTEVRRQPNGVEGPRVPSRLARTSQNFSRRTAAAGRPKRGIRRLSPAGALANDGGYAPLSAVILTEVRRQPNGVEGPRVPSRLARTSQNFSRRTAAAGRPKHGIPRLSPAGALANDGDYAPLSAVILTEVRRQTNGVEGPRVPSRRQERLRIFLGGPLPGAKRGIPRFSPACALASD